MTVVEPAVGSTPPWAGVTPAPGVKRKRIALADTGNYRDKRLSEIQRQRGGSVDRLGIDGAVD